MVSENAVELERVVEIDVEFRTDGFQLFQRKAIKFATLGDGSMDGVADGLVRTAEWHAFTDEIIGCLHGIHVTGGGGLLHAIGVERELANQLGGDAQRSQN